MAYQTILPPLNPFHMLPVDPPKPAKYNSGNIDVNWFSEMLRDWQQQERYYQKVQRGVRFRFEVSSSPFTSNSLKILDCCGGTVLTIAMTDSNDTITGNRDDDGDQMKAMMYKLDDLSDIVTDGVYYLLYTVTYDGSHSKQYISEPFLLKDNHPDTILLEYRHKEYLSFTHFQQLPAIYSFSVEGSVSDYDPQVDIVSFEDQPKSFKVLDSQAFLGAKLKIGINGDGVPDWVFLKLTEILRCSDIVYDGKYWERSGTTWNKIKVGDDDVYPLFGGTTDLREPEWLAKYSHGVGEVNIYTPPGTYPYAVASIVIGRSGGILVNAFTNAYDAVRIDDLAGENAFISALNSALANFEFLGTVARVGGIIKYINGPGENYNFASCLLMPKYFGYQVDTTGGPGYVANFSFSDGPVIIDWGDGQLGYGIAPAGPEITRSNTYAGTLNYQVTVFHDDTLKIVDIYEPNIDDLSGDFPIGLESLSIIGNGGIGSLSLAFLLPLVNLNTLLLQYLIGSPVTGLSPNPFGFIKYIYLNHNNMSSSDVNDIVIAVKNAVASSGIGSGKLWVHQQTPAAPLSAGAVIAKGYLTSNGWQVLND